MVGSDKDVSMAMDRCNKLVGEHLFIVPPTSAALAEAAGATVPVMLMPFSEKVSPTFMKQLAAAKQSSQGEKTYVLVKRDCGKNQGAKKTASAGEEKEEQCANEETQCALWLPAEFDLDGTHVHEHVHKGTCETFEIQERIDNGNTDSGNLKIEIMRNEFEVMKRIAGPQPQRLPRKLCRCLALTMAMACKTYWINNNEFPEEVTKRVNDVAKYWRTVLLVEADATLGLGASADAGAESREALLLLLRRQGAVLEAAGQGSYASVKFNAIPQRVRKRKGETDSQVAARRAALSAALNLR